MALKQVAKITDKQMDTVGVVAAPTVLTGTPAENKKVFDRMVRDLIAPTLNTMIENENQIVVNEEVRQGDEKTRKAQEAQRVQAETGRKSAEEARARAETQRASAEEARKADEQKRQAAEQARQSAETQRVAQVQAATDAAYQVTSHPPKVGPNGNWMVWVQSSGGYQDTGVAARGEKGEKGEKGDTGALVELGTGVFAMGVSPEGHLLVAVNAEETAPPLEIDQKTGHLIYKITN